MTFCNIILILILIFLQSLNRSVKNYTLLEILQSPFFKNLQQENLVGGEHSGGCSLFEQESKVKSILESAK